jgi:hypothetical protein
VLIKLLMSAVVQRYTGHEMQQGDRPYGTGRSGGVTAKLKNVRTGSSKD